MNLSTAVLDANTLRSVTWRDIEILSLKDVKRALIMKHGSLTYAANSLKIPYIRLISALSGRENVFSVIFALQRDLNLTNEQVLTLWPLLKKWPREHKN